MMKKAFLILFALLMMFLSFGLTACKNDGPVEKGATEIMFYARDFEDWSNDHLYDLVDEFNSIMDDGIQITMVMYEDAEYTQAIKSARDSGNAPDVFVVSYGNLAGEIQKGILAGENKKGYPAPLNDLIPQTAFDDIADYVKDMVCYDNVYYAYPQLTEPSSMLFYRKDILTAAQVTKSPALWNWNDLIDACAKIKPTLSKNQFTIGLPDGLALAWSTIGLQYNTAGYYPINDNWDASTLSADVGDTTNYQSENEYANVARLFWDLYGGGYVPIERVSPTGYTDIIEGMCDNKLALAFGGSWSVAEIVNTYPQYIDKIGIAPLPTKTGSKEGPTATNGGWTYAVSDASNSEKQQKAANFIKWLLADNAERTSEYFEIANYCKAPVTKSVQEYINANAGDNYLEWRNVINDVAQKAIPEPLYSFDISTKFADILGWISINADPSQNAVFDEQILAPKMATAITEINKVISLNSLAGTNPKNK